MASSHAWLSAEGETRNLMKSLFGDSTLYNARLKSLDKLFSMLKQPQKAIRRRDLIHFPHLNTLPSPSSCSFASRHSSDRGHAVSVSDADRKWIEAEMSKYGIDEGVRIVLVDGVYVPALSTISSSPNNGVKVRVVKEEDNQDVRFDIPIRAAKVHGRSQKTGMLENHPFTLLNSAFFSEAVLIESVSQNPAQSQSVSVINVTLNANVDAISTNALYSTRVQVRAAENSKVRVVEAHLCRSTQEVQSQSQSHSFPFTDIELERDSTCNRIIIFANDGEVMHKTTMVNCKGINSRFTSDSVMLRADDSTQCRDEIRVDLAAEHSSVSLNGVAVCMNDSSAFSHWYVEHQVPETSSEVKLRSVVGDKGNGYFRGHVYIDEEACKTTSDMYAKALVLSPTAQNHAQPRLEIYNPDVKATHGSTVGQLEISQLYYLMARGIPYNEASTMITLAFCRETLLRGECSKSMKKAIDGIMVETLSNAMTRSTPPSSMRSMFKYQRDTEAADAKDIVEIDIDIDVQQVRSEFPIFQHHRPHGRDLIYLDSGATTQKPKCVIDSVNQYYESSNANIHRGLYQLAEHATKHYDGTRAKLADFINAADQREIIFCKGTTEALNLVSNCVIGNQLKEGDEVLISSMEHHSNIVPWQLACDRVGAVLKIIPLVGEGEGKDVSVSEGHLDLVRFQEMLTDRTKIVSVTHISNVLATINPIKKMSEIIHSHYGYGDAHRPWLVVDGAQAVAHVKVDVQDLNVDFYAFSAHKMYGPTGIGCLYGRLELLDTLPPYQGGGDMIKSVTFEKTEYEDVPQRFEAGTQDMGGVAGLDAAVAFLQRLNLSAIRKHEVKIMRYALDKLSQINGLKVFGPRDATERSGAIAFTMPQFHAHDVATVVDQYGVAIRAGHHCCAPLHSILGVSGTARASLSVHTDENDIDELVNALKTGVDSDKDKKAVSVPSRVQTPSQKLQKLYTKIVRDHGNNPKNRYLMEHHTHSIEAYNSNCGDRLVMFVAIEDGIFKEISFVDRAADGSCSLCVASASLLTLRLKGEKVENLEQLFSSFKNLISIQADSDATMAAYKEELGDRLCSFSGLARFPTRVRCALLSWSGLITIVRQNK